jgi:hypothetical protein
MSVPSPRSALQLNFSWTRSSVEPRSPDGIYLIGFFLLQVYGQVVTGFLPSSPHAVLATIGVASMLFFASQL